MLRCRRRRSAAAAGQFGAPVGDAPVVVANYSLGLSAANAEKKAENIARGRRLADTEVYPRM